MTSLGTRIFEDVIKIRSSWLRVGSATATSVFKRRDAAEDTLKKAVRLPKWLGVKKLPTNAEDVGSIPGSGRSPGEGDGNPLQYSCLENPWREEPGWLQSMEVSRSRTQLSD